MADDKETDPDKGDPDPDPTKEPGTDSLGDSGKKALDAERKARRDAEHKLADVQKRLDELADKDKTELQRALDKAAAAEKRAEEADARALRMEVAVSRGMTSEKAKKLLVRAKRLVGTTKEELESDADELFDDLVEKEDPDGDKQGGPPSSRPKPTLRGGSDPTQEPEEMDPRKLAASIPRS